MEAAIKSLQDYVAQLKHVIVEQEDELKSLRPVIAEKSAPVSSIDDNDLVLPPDEAHFIIMDTAFIASSIITINPLCDTLNEGYVMSERLTFYRFFEREVVKVASEEVSIDDIYTYYAGWCLDRGGEIAMREDFVKAMATSSDGKTFPGLTYRENPTHLLKSFLSDIAGDRRITIASVTFRYAYRRWIDEKGFRLIDVNDVKLCDIGYTKKIHWDDTADLYDIHVDPKKYEKYAYDDTIAALTTDDFEPLKFPGDSAFAHYMNEHFFRYTRKRLMNVSISDSMLFPELVAGHEPYAVAREGLAVRYRHRLIDAGFDVHYDRNRSCIVESNRRCIVKGIISKDDDEVHLVTFFNKHCVLKSGSPALLLSEIYRAYDAFIGKTSSRSQQKQLDAYLTGMGITIMSAYATGLILV